MLQRINCSLQHITQGMSVTVLLGQKLKLLNNFKFIFSFQSGRSALILASRNGHTQIAKYLIEAKASLDLQRQVYCVSSFDES